MLDKVLLLGLLLSVAASAGSELELPEGRAKKTNFCPPGSQFSTFGFAAFIMITLQTVVNVVSANNNNNNNANNNNNNDNNNDNNLNFNENDATV